MITATKAIDLAQQDNMPHDWVFIAKGSANRKGGYTVNIPRGVVTSTNHSGTVNIMNLDSRRVRKLHFVSLIKYDGIEVII